MDTEFGIPRELPDLQRQRSLNQPLLPPGHQRKKWGCWGGFPCFGAQKGGKRIVPSTRAPDGSAPANQPAGGSQTANQTTSIAPHLLAPPSSPASFSNSALPSTAQSPRCHLSMSVSSPGGPSSTMFATGPYAHETQLVTPPVFSTFTTEPSTAPFTPPPELAHLTTPSSPDVPYAHFLSSAADLNCAGKNNYVPSSDLQTTYPLSPGSPASSLRSPVSRTSVDCLSFPERERHIAKHPKNASEWLTNENGKSQASNFFCPATFAQFYLDQPHSGGRLSISKESDNGTVNQSKQNKNNWQDAEELEAYRASFGFSADEMITTPQYVEISDVMDDSFTMVPCTSNKSPVVEATLVGWGHGGSRKSDNNFIGERSTKSGSDINGKGCQGVVSSKHLGDENSDEEPRRVLEQRAVRSIGLTDDEDIFSNMGKRKNSRKCNIGSSCSDAEVEYRRGRSLRECNLTWH
ncbi:uncharacterized protein At1g76660 [Amaranthus tricolor]|uniref:uncharacterized protein At1g76660 n=1 Tax=Amaranthus tricolor TaxID=29722 RepID=UPI00258A780F|nr:uncharacterized protein At1g76660 [Amaranthus tricolor]